MEKQCKGIMGKLFGHNIKKAVDTRRGDLSEAQITALDKLAATTGAWETAVSTSYTKTVVAIYCKRCGQLENVEARKEATHLETCAAGKANLVVEKTYPVDAPLVNVESDLLCMKKDLMENHHVACN